VNTFIVALKHEAQPLIEEDGLTLLSHEPFKVYQNQSARLVISGVGQKASFAATNFALTDHAKHHGLWINLGVAGHRHLPSGTPVTISKVTDKTTARAWYPATRRTPYHQIKELITCQNPTNNYPSEECCDMEAAGFMAAVSKIIPCEHIHVLKIISDNANIHPNTLTKLHLRELIKKNLTATYTYIKEAQQYLAVNPKTFPPAADAIFKKWHFTFTQTQQLLELYRSFAAVCPDERWPNVNLNECNKASQVLTKLSAQLTQLSPSL